MTGMTDEELHTVYNQAAISGLCTQEHKINEQIISVADAIATDAVAAHRERYPSGKDKD